MYPVSVNHYVSSLPFIAFPSAITVGNEFVLDYLSDNGGSGQDINGPVANQAADQLIEMLNITKTWWNNLGYNKSMHFCNADAGSYFNEMVVEAFDCLVRKKFFAEILIIHLIIGQDVERAPLFCWRSCRSSSCMGLPI